MIMKTKAIIPMFYIRVVRSAVCSRRLFLLLIFVIVTGCASNPYIENTRPGAYEKKVTSSQSSEDRAEEQKGGAYKPPLTRGTLEYSLQYADDTYDAYEAKLAEEFKRQQYLSSGLLTLGAGVVKLAINGASASTIGSTALAGGLAYQLGTWNSNQNRLGIYIEGMKALSCSKIAIVPLRISDDKLERIMERSNELYTAVDQASNAVGDVTMYLAIATANPNGKTPLIQSAESELAEIGGVFDRANDLLAKSTGLESKVQNAGALLEGKIDEVRREVDKAVNGTLADLSNLPKVIGSISDYANIFAPGLKLGSTLSNAISAMKPISSDIVPNAEAGEESERITADNVDFLLARSLGKLRAERQKLLARLAELSGVVESTTVEQLKSSLETCGVDVEKISSGISLDRSVVTFKPNSAGTSMVTISGGTLPYSSAIVDLPADGINISTPPGSNLLIVSATDKTESNNSYQVKVADSANHTAMLTVKVAAKEVSAPVGDDKKKKNNVGCSGGESRDPAEICLMQHIVKTKVDGGFGPNTCEKLKGAREMLGFPVGSIFATNINNETMDAIKRKAGLKLGLSESADLKQIQDKLTAENINVPKCFENKIVVAPTFSDECKSISSDTACKVKGAKCALECEMNPSEVERLRLNLKDVAPGLDPTPLEFDEPLREAIIKFQKAQGMANQTGKYTEATAKAVEKKYAD